ncbi:MAG: hypothetical protein KIT09_16075 [Bryobacteraceae bacterium]|nr:hypothetical protein [Bryobacteraceae bacterium]
MPTSILREATPEMAAEYTSWFVNRCAYTRQSDRPHRESGRHYYYRPRSGGRASARLTTETIRRHLAGNLTVGLYSINPKTQRVKWVAIDADYRSALEDLLKLQYELKQDGVQAALEQSRRGGHLWVLFDSPVLAREARIYVRHLAERLSVEVKGSGLTEGIELFPKQDRLREGEFGNAIRGPLGVHRAAGRRYWFYGAPYDLGPQFAYLRALRRMTESELRSLIRELPVETEGEPPRAAPFQGSGNGRCFRIFDYVESRRKVGRNWVAQCPSCAAAGRDTSKDNLAISVEEPQKYICWAGCSKEMIRAALGAPPPVSS